MDLSQQELDRLSRALGNGVAPSEGVWPSGIARVRGLPDPVFDTLWSHLFLPPGVKERLLSYGLTCLRHRQRLSPLRGAPRGLLVLVGEPGTGKTTAARGLASALAAALSDAGTSTCVELEPHALPSEMLGQSQRNVMRLLGTSLPAVADVRDFTVALVDELESFAINRKAASFDTNPADLHRATDAVLSGLDHLVELCPRLLVIATTNHPAAVDDALLSRADHVETFQLPDAPTVHRIVVDTLEELAGAWPGLRWLAGSESLADEVADVCAGMDGRQIRKLALAALASRPQVASDPARLTEADVLDAARALARQRPRGYGIMDAAASRSHPGTP